MWPQMEGQLTRQSKGREGEVAFLQEQLEAERARTAEWKARAEELTKQMNQHVQTHATTVRPLPTSSRVVTHPRNPQHSKV